MLDIKFIRENPDKVKEGCKKKFTDHKIVDQVLDVDRKRRELIQEVEKIQAEKNKANERISAAKTKEEKQKIIGEMREIDKKGDDLKEELKNTEEKFTELMLKIPNLPLDDVPVGEDENSNKPIRKWGTPKKFDFKVKDHVTLGKELDIIDIETAAKVAGTRFNYLKNEAVLLQFALVRYTFDVLTSPKIIRKIADSVERGYPAKTFIPVVPPVMIRPDIYIKMARLSEEDKEERYHFPKDDLYLIGSAEHTLGPLHMDEIIDEKNLPLRYLGYSTSFRREAGSYGKDTRGIFRVHQFDKLEMESFTSPENSLKEQEFFIAIQEYLMQSLKIPYQVVAICTGDAGMPDARQIDIEAWIPSQNKYRETHTSDLMTDYQARRLNIRIRRRDGKTEILHMNDATAFAIGRTLIAIIENYQQKDGSITIPKVLQSYCNGLKVVKKKA